MNNPRRGKWVGSLWLGAGLVIILIALSWGHYYVLSRIEAQQHHEDTQKQEQHVTQQAQRLEKVLQEIYFDLQDISSSLLDEDTNDTKVRRLTGSWVDSHPDRVYVKAMFLAEPDGNLIGKHSSIGLQNLDIPIHLLARRLEWHDQQAAFRKIDSPGTDYLQITHPIRKDDRDLGNLSIIIDLPELLSHFSVTSSAGGEFYALLDQKLQILCAAEGSLQPEQMAQKLDTILPLEKGFLEAVARGTSYSQTVVMPWQEDRGPVLLSVSPIQLPSHLWSLSYTIPTNHLGTPGIAATLLSISLAIAWLGAGLIFLLTWQKRCQVNILTKELTESEQQRQNLESELSDHRSRSQQILYNANDALFFVDMQTGELIEINRQAEDLLGYTRGEVEHLSFKVIFPKPYRQKFLRLVAEVRNKGQAAEEEMKFRRKDGSLFIGAVQVRAGMLGDRRVVHGSFRDVTPTVNLAIELRRHNRRLSLLNEISQRVAEGRDLPSTLNIILDQVIDSMDVSGGGIFLLQHQGTEMNLAIHRSIPAEVLQDLSRMQPGEGLAGKVATTGRPRMSTNLQNDHRRISTAVANDDWHAFLAVPLLAEEATLGVLFIFDRGSRVMNREDVRLMQAIGRQVGPLVKNAELFDELQWQHRINQASLRELERSRAALRENLDQLEQHHQMLQSLDQMKSTFLGLASHELRTPLTNILSGAELLKESGTALNENDYRALDGILQGSQRLNQVVDDLLEAARIEAKTLYLAQEVFNPKPLVEDLVAEHQEACQTRQLDCILEAFPVAARIRGDEHHLKRALTRLMENAIKFTPDGGWIRLRGDLKERTEIVENRDHLKHFSSAFFDKEITGRYLEISIRDNGIGIEPEDHDRIFDKFSEIGDISGHSTSKSRFGGKGAGLGLTLARGIVEAHNGQIWVESAGSAKGSCFSILLPLEETPEGCHENG